MTITVDLDADRDDVEDLLAEFTAQDPEFPEALAAAEERRAPGG